MKRLTEKLCVVTGAGRGIGEAIAQAFHNEGATVVVTDKDTATGLAVAEQPPAISWNWKFLAKVTGKTSPPNSPI